MILILYSSILKLSATGICGLCLTVCVPFPILVVSSGRFRKTGEGWPLLTIETEVNGDSKRTNERGPFLVGSLGLSCRCNRLLSCLGCSSRPSSKYFLTVHYFNSFVPTGTASWVQNYRKIPLIQFNPWRIQKNVGANICMIPSVAAEYVHFFLYWYQRPNSKRNMWYGNPMLELIIYNITSSHSPLRSSELQLSRHRTANTDESFPSYLKMEQAIGLGRVWGRGVRRVERSAMILCLRIDIFLSMGIPMPDLTLTTLHSWLEFL